MPFPWDSDITTAFEHVYQSLDNQDRFEAGEEDWAPEHRSNRLVLLLTDGDFIAAAEQMPRFDVALTEFQRRGLRVYSIGIGSRIGVDLNVVLQDYILDVDYDTTLEADLEGLRTSLNMESLTLIEQRDSWSNPMLLTIRRPRLLRSFVTLSTSIAASRSN